MNNRKLNGKAYWQGEIICSKAGRNIHQVQSILCPYEDHLIDITIFISSYNEEKFIEDTLSTAVKAMTIIGKTYEIIIIDDGSTDNSIELIRKFIISHPHVNMLLRINKQNKGLAQNFLDAAFIGRGKYFRLICGDNPEPLELLVTIFKELDQADIIIPYHVTVPGKSKFRKGLSKIYTWLINFISGNKIKYYNGLQIHLRYNVMRWHPNTRGFAFQASLLCLLLEMGFSYKEVPCFPIERRGKSDNALTWKNLRSVIHVITSIILRKLVH